MINYSILSKYLFSFFVFFIIHISYYPLSKLGLIDFTLKPHLFLILFLIYIIILYKFNNYKVLMNRKVFYFINIVILYYLLLCLLILFGIYKTTYSLFDIFRIVSSFFLMIIILFFAKKNLIDLKIYVNISYYSIVILTIYYITFFGFDQDTYSIHIFYKDHNIFTPIKGYIALSLMFPLFYFFINKNHYKFSISLIILLFVTSRASFVAIIFSILLYKLSNNFKNVFTKKILIILLTLFFLAISFLLLLIEIYGVQSVILLSSGRYIIYQAYFNTFISNFIFGLGENITYTTELKNSIIHLTELYNFDKIGIFGKQGNVAPHNDWLFVVTKYGIVGLLFIISLFYVFLKDIKFVNKNSSEYKIIIFFIVSWSIFIFFDNAYTWPPFWVFIALAYYNLQLRIKIENTNN